MAGGHAQCTEEMLAIGANVDATDKDGLTALMKAASRRKLQCVQILLAAEVEARHRTPCPRDRL